MSITQDEGIFSILRETSSHFPRDPSPQSRLDEFSKYSSGYRPAVVVTVTMVSTVKEEVEEGEEGEATTKKTTITVIFKNITILLMVLVTVSILF